MKNVKFYHKNLEHVDCVLEIRLCMDIWEKIQKVATMRDKSYSWVVRCSVFRLIKRKDLNKYIMSGQDCQFPLSFTRVSMFSEVNKKALERRHQNSEKHRHRLCLYGEDELFLRLSAARLRCTMTHLVRLALEKYLNSLLIVTNPFSRSKVNRYRDAVWYWLGIKVHYDVEFPSIDSSKVCFQFQRYHKLDYW